MVWYGMIWYAKPSEHLLGLLLLPLIFCSRIDQTQNEENYINSHSLSEDIILALCILLKLPSGSCESVVVHMSASHPRNLSTNALVREAHLNTIMM